MAEVLWVLLSIQCVDPLVRRYEHGFVYDIAADLTRDRSLPRLLAIRCKADETTIGVGEDGVIFRDRLFGDGHRLDRTVMERCVPAFLAGRCATGMESVGADVYSLVEEGHTWSVLFARVPQRSRCLVTFSGLEVDRRRQRRAVVDFGQTVLDVGIDEEFVRRLSLAVGVVRSLLTASLSGSILIAGIFASWLVSFVTPNASHDVA
ncbi:hypothetical protein [Haloterrigena salifodinae]|nr:hypothetical protein [Haloterrigena salifodinae]